MNTHVRLPKHLHDVDSKARCRRIFCFHIRKEKCKCRPIGNKEIKTNQYVTRIKNCIEFEMLYFERILPFTIHIHDRSGKFKWLWY
jgi:hypothetical protein